tara:strand:- start:110 stop:391 length:282 start_codon:yes stop_codon:yes gene_type:complete
MYELLVDFSDGDVSETDVRVLMTDCYYKYCLPSWKSLWFRYIVFLSDGKEIPRDINFRDEMIPHFIDINKSELEESILDLIKKDSRFTNVREV